MTRTVDTINDEIRKIRKRVGEKDHQGALRLCAGLAQAPMSGEDRAELLHLQGLALWLVGDRVRALKSLSLAVSVDPTRAVIWTALARLQRETGSGFAAIRSALSATKVDPAYADAYVVLGDLFRDGRRPKRAAQAYESALKLRPDLEGALVGLALAKGAFGDAKGAVSLYRRLVRKSPESPLFRINLAINLTQSGKGQEAARVAGELIRPGHKGRKRPELSDDVRARALSAVIDYERERPIEDALSEAREMASRPEVGWDKRTKLLAALGRYEERRGDLDAAMRFWSEQSRVSSEENPYKRRVMDVYLAETRRVWTPDLVTRLSGMSESREAPILIVGMPRSGTTLVEQILGQHPEVDPGGELYDLGDVTRELMPAGGPAALLERSEEELRALIRKGGTIYADGLDQYRVSGSRVTDKMPENFKMLGVAAAVMPNLRVLHMRRDPRDVCFSIWKLKFDNDGHAYGNRFEDLAHYYRVHEELIAHWSAILPGVIHTVTYEDLVADPEGEGRRLVEHCGLDWSADLLDFSASDRGVRTASTAQVRERINTKGVGRWRPFEPRLDRMFAALRAEGLLDAAGRPPGLNCEKK
jgi:tetratricopeptide (TPR) repeat protein